jgi:hypothetical protein
VPNSRFVAVSVHTPSSTHRQQSLQSGSLQKTGCRQRAIRHARSNPDIQMRSLNVSIGATISMTAAPATAYSQTVNKKINFVREAGKSID